MSGLKKVGRWSPRALIKISEIMERQILCRCENCATVFRTINDHLTSSAGLVKCKVWGEIFNAQWNLVDEIPNPADSKSPVNSATTSKPPIKSKKNGKNISRFRDDPPDFSLNDQLRQDLRTDKDESMGLDEIRKTFGENIGDSALGTKDFQEDARLTSSYEQPHIDDRRYNRSHSPKRSSNVSTKESSNSSLKSLSLWLTGTLIAILVLYGQVRYILFDELAAIPSARPSLALFCDILRCTVPAPLKGPALRILETRVDLDPQLPGAVIVKFHLENRTTIARPYPNIELILTDRKGAIVGQRTYAPIDYQTTNNSYEIFPGIVSIATLHLAGPDERAVGFEAKIIDQ